MTIEEFAVIAATLQAGAPEKRLPKATLDLWFELLGDLPARVVLGAVKAHYATSEYPTLPAIGAVRKAAVALMHPAIPTAAEAWGQVEHEMRRVGWVGKPDLSPLTARVVKAIGWQRLCASEDPGVERGQFLKMYDQMAQRDEHDAVLPDGLKPGAMAPALPEGIRRGLDAIGNGGRVVPMERSGR